MFFGYISGVCVNRKIHTIRSREIAFHFYVASVLKVDLIFLVESRSVGMSHDESHVHFKLSKQGCILASLPFFFNEFKHFWMN